MRRLRGPAAVLAPALLLTGCAQSVDPIERLGKKAAEGVRPHATAPGRDYRHWGLTRPLARPRHPRTARRPSHRRPRPARRPSHRRPRPARSPDTRRPPPRRPR